MNNKNDTKVERELSRKKNGLSGNGSGITEGNGDKYDQHIVYTCIKLLNNKQNWAMCHLYGYIVLLVLIKLKYFYFEINVIWIPKCLNSQEMWLTGSKAEYRKREGQLLTAVGKDT